MYENNAWSLCNLLFFYWFLGSSFATMYWFMTFVYDPYEIKQLEDKKDKKHITNK